MANKMVQYNDQVDDVERFYFVGTDTLVAGQILCFQETPASSTKGFGVDVEIPNTNNQRHIAGVVDTRSVGVTGPAWVHVKRPKRGNIDQVLVGNKAAVAVGHVLKMDFDIPTATGSELGALAILGASTVAASNQDLDIACAVALESVAASTAHGGTARALKWIKWL